MNVILLLFNVLVKERRRKKKKKNNSSILLLVARLSNLTTLQLLLLVMVSGSFIFRCTFIFIALYSFYMLQFMFFFLCHGSGWYEKSTTQDFGEDHCIWTSFYFFFTIVGWHKECDSNRNKKKTIHCIRFVHFLVRNLLFYLFTRRVKCFTVSATELRI